MTEQIIINNITNINPIPLRPWYQKWWGIIILLFLFFFFSCLVAFSFLVLDKANKLKNNPTSNIASSTAEYKNTEGVNSYWFGSDSPKLTIVEFGDFACPHCKNSYSIIRSLGLKYGKNVKVIFRHYPYISNYSLDLAMAAECAGLQNLFWPMHDKLFQYQGVSSKEEIDGLARQIGADIAKLNACIDNKIPEQKITKDITDAETFKVAGTPTWFFNGNKIEGEIPVDVMEKIIKEMTR